MKRILFIHMPLAVPTMPNLAVELLSAIAIRNGLLADVFYGTCRLRNTPVLSAYIHSISGGIMFTPTYYRNRSPETVVRSMLDCPKAISELSGNYSRFTSERDSKQIGWPISRRKVTKQWPYNSPCDDLLADVLTHMDLAALCIDQCLFDVPPGRYDVYAFSLMFDAQKLPSLALANRLKERESSARIVFGGSACDGDMGLELIERFPFIDMVAQGEADLNIVNIVRALRGETPWELVPGIVFRQAGKTVRTPQAPRLNSLDSLPIPNYESFLEQLQTSDWRDEAPFILFEASRGCWWGEKHHCLFCGLRADDLAFRRKSSLRLVSELEILGGRFRRHRALYSTDAILDYRALREWMPLLPPLAHRHKWNLFFELKSNLRKEEVALLAEAGVGSVQPGIETFSDRVLDLMKKGSRGLENVQLLKWLASYQINVIYNFILAIPGEMPEDYEEVAEMIPYLWHLPVPTSINYVSLDRFSPYMREPDKYGFQEVKEDTIYAVLFPDPTLNLSRLAYKFQYRSFEMGSAAHHNAWGEIELAVQTWREKHDLHHIFLKDSGDSIEIIQEQPEGRNVTELRGLAASLYRFCDLCRTFTAVRQAFPDVSEKSLRACLTAWVAKRWMYRSRSDRYLALAVDLCPSTSGRKAPIELHAEEESLRPWVASDPPPPLVSQTGAV